MEEKLPQLRLSGTPIAKTECPSCGVVRIRTASSFTQKIDGELRLRFSCGARDCHRVYDVFFNLVGTHTTIN